MRVNRQQQATRMLLALAAVLGSLWAGGLAASAVGDPAGRLTEGRPRAAIEAAVLRDRVPALRPPSERPGPRGYPLLLGAMVAALAGAAGWRAGVLRLRPVGVRSLVRSTSLGARAPPHLQSA